jgi:hypothetical protein
MKTRNAFSLLYALSLLIISAGSGRAQLNPAYPYDVALTLETSFLTYDFHQASTTPVTIRGSITDMSGLGADKMMINITSAAQWVISTKIGGYAVQDGTTINLGSNQVLPIEITIVPYADRPDTESYCLRLSLSPTYQLNHQCITLAVTNNPSAVRDDLPAPNITIWPNPAGSYMFVRGLDEVTGYRYEIYSVSGAEIRHGSLPADSRLNIQNISDGAYKFLLFDGKRMLTNTEFTVLH